MPGQRVARGISRASATVAGQERRDCSGSKSELTLKPTPFTVPAECELNLRPIQKPVADSQSCDFTLLPEQGVSTITMESANSRSFWLSGLACLLSMLAVSGCTLMLPGSEQLTVNKNPLPPIVASRDTIDLEVYFIDRRIGDPLIGESLWSCLSSLTAVAAENQTHLSEDGFRFGMASSRPPRSLQSLLRLSDEQDPMRRVVPHRYTVPSGQETLLMISQVPNGTPLIRKTAEGVKTTELNQAQCLLRVSAERMDGNWARLSITPEIRHGASALRPVATDQNWQYHEGQQVIPFYQHRLTAELNTGEVVVLGLDAAQPDGLASFFFRSDISSGIERLILVRVGEMHKVAPVRVESH